MKINVQLNDTKTKNTENAALGRRGVWNDRQRAWVCQQCTHYHMYTISQNGLYKYRWQLLRCLRLKTLHCIICMAFLRYLRINATMQPMFNYAAYTRTLCTHTHTHTRIANCLLQALYDRRTYTQAWDFPLFVYISWYSHTHTHI